MSSNSIYSFLPVTQFINTLNLSDVYNKHYSHHIKKLFPDLYAKIINYTTDMSVQSFTERLYFYTNKITTRPSCKLCSTTVTYSSRNKQFNTYCSQRCALSDMKSLIGVSNTSQLQSVKDKKRASAIAKYGVDNVSKATIVKAVISKKATTRWENEYQHSVLPISVQEYQRIVWRYSNKAYRESKIIIDPNNIRSTEWHLDHKFSVSEGYKNSISPEIMGHFTNLQILDRYTNCVTKNSKSSVTLDELLAAFTNSIT